MNLFTWREQYDIEQDEDARAHTRIQNEEPSLTQQQFTDEVNLNNVLLRFGVTDIDPRALGTFDPSVLANPNLFGDFTGERNVDLRQALEITKAAADGFNSLPAAIRRKFNNDPAEMHDWLLDPANKPEAIKMGLLHTTPEPEPELGSEKRPFWTQTKPAEKPAETPAKTPTTGVSTGT